MPTVNPDTVEPITYQTRNFFHDGLNNGFLGDYVTTPHYRGRVHDAHFGCPEGALWLAGQTHLGADPTLFKDCRWVSILVSGGGAIVVPEQFVTVIKPFDLDNDSEGLYFPKRPR